MKSLKFLKTILTTALAAQSLLIAFTTTHSLANDDVTADNIPIGSVLDFGKDTYIPMPTADNPDWGHTTLGSDDRYACILYGHKNLFTSGKPLLRIQAGSPKPIISIVVYPEQDLVQFWLNKERTVAVNCGNPPGTKHNRSSVDYPTIKRVRDLLSIGSVGLTEPVSITLDAQDI